MAYQLTDEDRNLVQQRVAQVQRGRNAEAEAQKKPKVGGLQGFLANALPIIGGAVGSVGGTFLGGPVGTFAGGAAGSGFGEFLRQQILGEEADLGSVAREAALGAVPGGLGLAAKGAKMAKTGSAVAKTGATKGPTSRMPLDKLTSYEGAPDKARVEEYKQMIQAGKDVGSLKVAPDSTGAMGIEDGKHRFQAFKELGFSDAPVDVTQKPGMAQRVRQGAANQSQEGFGLTVGQSKGGGRVMTPQDADALQGFITGGAQKYGGIRPGKPIDQARDAQNVLNNVTAALDDTLTKINRNVTPDEINTIAGSIRDKVGVNALVGKTSNTANKLTAKLQSARDLRDLEAIRREADNIAFTQTGAKKTSAAAQAKEVRDAIDEFITPLSDDYKAIKGDYVLARDALDATSKANKSAKGFKIPFIEVEVGKQAIPGVKNKAAAKIAGQEVQQQRTGGFRPFVRPAMQQTGTRLASTALLGTPFVGSPQEEQQQPTQNAEMLAQEQSMLDQAQSQPQQPSESKQLFDSALKYMQETGDLKGTQALAALAQQAAEMEKLSGGGAEKPLSAEAARSVSNAQAGLESIDLLRQAQAENPNARGLSAISGTFDPFGIVSNTLGTGQYENARQQAIDIIARLRTGAAITKDEESRFMRMLPQAGDSEATVEQKLGILQRQFQRVADRSASATSRDPSEVLAGV